MCALRLAGAFGRPVLAGIVFFGLQIHLALGQLLPIENSLTGPESSVQTPQPPPPPETLKDDCVVSILNRVTTVQPDGTWLEANAPTGFPPTRARATCVRNGTTLFGQSDLFTLAPNESLTLPDITLGNTTPIPLSISITAPVPSLNQASQATQLTVTATYTNGPQDITAASSGTQYQSSNPAIATVGPNGLLTAVGSGTAVIQASNEGAEGLFTVQVALSVDSDGDGIPDDAELRLGLNPHDPTDALLDFDHDGLTNLQEYQIGTDIRNPDTDGDGLTDGQEVLLYHTNPLLASTDGSGIPDGIEVQTGTLGGTLSAKFAAALVSLELQPATFTLTVNSLTNQASQQLTVIGHLLDGKTTVDLTSTAKGTTYGSSDITICNFGAPDGTVFAGNTGSCTVTVTNGSVSATAIGTVTGFSPTPLSSLAIPGYANHVAIEGNYAYIAAGSAGLQIVDVSKPAAPKIVAALALAGNANGIKVVGNTVYLAGGSAGLQIVDVTNPLAPALLGSVTTPGAAWNMVVAAGVAYVASDTAGLTLIDVTNSAHPFQLASVPLAGTTKGVDVDIVRKLAVAVGSAGLFTVDVSNGAAPALLGSVTYGGDPRDVEIKGTLALVADFSKSLSAVDVGAPAQPLYLTSTDVSLGGNLEDVAVAGNFALGAVQNFLSTAASITDISNPPTLLSRAILDFPGGKYAGTGIAADSQYVYMTGSPGSSITTNGVTGNTQLFIGQYFSGQNVSTVDKIPPTVSIVSPAAGTTVIQGTQLQITAQAADDQAVAGVNFSANGQTVFGATSPPYQFIYTVPANATSLTLGAQAVDYGNNTANATLVVNVIPDPLTTAHGTVVDPQNNLISGATITCQNKTGTSAADGTFRLGGLSTIQGAIQCTAAISGRTSKSFALAPVRGGTTELGLIVMSASASRGRDFWLTCPNGGQNSNGSVVCEIFIVTDGSANYTLTSDPVFQFSASGTVTAQAPAVINIPASLPPGCITTCTPFGLAMNGAASDINVVPGTVENQGIHVIADADVSVSLFIPFLPGNDMYLAVPTVSLGKTYYPILWLTNALSAQEMGITATQDNTHITLTNLCSLFPRTPVSPPALSAGQTYEVTCASSWGDMSNALITSDAPVSVVVEDPYSFTGEFTNAGGPGIGGPITEMMLPADGPAWGTEFFSVPLPYGFTEVYEIRAAQDSTTVTVDQGNGTPQTFNLNQGQVVGNFFAPLQFKSGAHFTSNKPIMVVQYSTCTNGCMGELGGNAEMQLLPTSDFGNSFRFYTPADDPGAIKEGVLPWSRFAVIIAPNSGIGSVQVNGTAATGFTPLPGGTYQYAIVPVPQGQNVVTSTQPITVYSIGFNSGGAYGMPTSF